MPISTSSGSSPRISASTSSAGSKKDRSIRGLGELAAIEALDRFLRSDAMAEALLLFEDTDIAGAVRWWTSGVNLISTGDFLRELEAAGLIQSTDQILDEGCPEGAERGAATSYVERCVSTRAAWGAVEGSRR